MDSTPLLSARSNDRQERDESPSPSHGTTDSFPTEYYNDDIPPTYTHSDADGALRSGRYAHPVTRVELAEIGFHAIRVQHRTRPCRRQRQYDLEGAEERDMEAELQSYKSVCVALTAFIILIFSNMWVFLLLRETNL